MHRIHTHTQTNLLELINKSRKLPRYKINTQKPILFLYTSKQLEKEIKETTPFIVASKRIKFLGIHLTKEIENLYIETIKHCSK